MVFFLFVFSNFIINMVPLLLLIAFLTLMERKVMAMVQRRRGPNVVGFWGMLQPFADGLKLFLKEPVFPKNISVIIFSTGPLLIFILSIFNWNFIPSGLYINFLEYEFSLLFILAFSSISVYCLILVGWSSNSKYAFLGSIRAAAQLISYEISISLILMPIIIYSESFNLKRIVFIQEDNFNFGYTFPILFLAFLISVLAETNRTPFDLPEAEGELVAGFNVEYSSLVFGFFFLAEYCNIIFLCFLSVFLFLGGCFFLLKAIFLTCFKAVLLIYLVILTRALLPRYRYDQLINIGWIVLLPISLSYLFFIIGLTYFFIAFL